MGAMVPHLELPGRRCCPGPRPPAPPGVNGGYLRGWRTRTTTRRTIFPRNSCRSDVSRSDQPFVSGQQRFRSISIEENCSTDCLIMAELFGLYILETVDAGRTGHLVV